LLLLLLLLLLSLMSLLMLLLIFNFLLILMLLCSLLLLLLQLLMLLIAVACWLVAVRAASAARAGAIASVNADPAMQYGAHPKAARENCREGRDSFKRRLPRRPRQMQEEAAAKTCEQVAAKAWEQAKKRSGISDCRQFTYNCLKRKT
jgi:hypothetical protein